MVQPIAELFAMPHPTRMVILGKGPSLDHWWNDPNGVTYKTPNCCWLGLNEVVELYGSREPCMLDAVIYIDRKLADLEIPESVTILRPKDQEDKHDGRGYVFQIGTDLPNTARSTGPVALNIALQWGCTDILLVGFDAFDCPHVLAANRYAKCLRQLRTKPGAYNYTTPQRQFLEVLKTISSGISVRWLHREIADWDT